MYAYQQALEKAAAFVSSNALVSSSEASLVPVQGDEVSVLDGPYADVREQFGGYFIIDVADMDEANKWAATGSTWPSLPSDLRTTDFAVAIYRPSKCLAQSNGGFGPSGDQ
ncbi:hypothetical protein HJA88_22130 [Rhizobium bangladeshense]|nr:hypothetical protein [Rhizobium bangladeshense]